MKALLLRAAARYIIRNAPPIRHAVSCACFACRRFHAGYFAAASESSRIAERDRRARDLGAFTEEEWRLIIAISERSVES